MNPSWPDSVFDVPVLRGLDVASRGALVAAGAIVERAAGAAIYREGDDSDSFFVVIAGAVELRAVRRGDVDASLLRMARHGDSFGEEALLPGIPRRVSATAAGTGAVRLAEIPVAVFRRAAGRTEDARATDREWRYLQRAAARDLLACSAFARDLDAGDVDVLLDGMRLERFARGVRLFEAGDRADAMFFVVEGLIQLQRDDSVCAYLARGDFFGDQEALAGGPRAVAAVASGDTWCAVLPREVMRTLADRNPGLLPRLRRIAESRGEAQDGVMRAAEARSTRHVFHDLYRMQMARSLLAIDQDQCVRCGHCAWSCADTHGGVSRLIRRGDKVMTGLHGVLAALMLPNTCQQCRHAACMVDCPTGAIGRDVEGEVFIREDLCTGCGNCAKSCPWDNIQMAPSGTPAKDVAVKCDLCRGFEAPACVEACPVGAVLRLDPGRDIAEVAQVLGVAQTGVSPRARGRGIATALATAAAFAIGGVGWAMQRAGRWAPDHGVGLGAGVVAALLIVLLAGYSIPKRLARRRERVAGMRRADRAPRSRTQRHLAVHLVAGVIAPACVMAHAVRMPATPGGALLAALGVATVLGVIGAAVYRVIPRRLTRLERSGTLPEDLAAEREALRTRLYREMTGAGTRVKLLAERLVLPYAEAPLGWLALVLAGRTLAEEEARLTARIDALLEGRLRDETATLVKIAVEQRALTARRVLGAALRGWMPLHIVSGAVVVALLIAHVVAVA